MAKGAWSTDSCPSPCADSGLENPESDKLGQRREEGSRKSACCSFAVCWVWLTCSKEKVK